MDFLHSGCFPLAQYFATPSHRLKDTDFEAPSFASHFQMQVAQGCMDGARLRWKRTTLSFLSIPTEQQASL